MLRLPAPATQKPSPATQFAPRHHLTQPWQCDSQKTRDTTGTQMIKCIAPVTQNDVWHIMKHVGMSQSAMTATRNEVAQRLNRLKVEPPKVTTFAALPIGTAVAQSSRTVADGCERLRTQKQRRANTSQPPDPQSKMRTLHYAFGNKTGHHNTRNVEMIDGKSFKQTNKIKQNQTNKLTGAHAHVIAFLSLSADFAI